ncbi:MAG: hypothetical protein IH585_13755 [Anaerolineaceae bacterium]|nr:hypothetical protein [Anaerolineaceae bacterium]
MTNKVNETNTQKIGMLPTTAQGKLFEIHVKGQLDQSWSDWLDGLDVKLLDNGEMILFGHIGDQAALMGTLNKLYSLNLTLLSLSKVDQKD